MISERYAKAMAETLHYLKGIRQEDIDKIPKSFIYYLEENSDKNYKCDFDYTCALKDLVLMNETRGLISMICLNYLCETEEQKQKLINKLNENERIYQEELNKKYDLKNMFENNNIPKKDVYKQENLQIIECKNYNLFKKFLNRIKELFHLI